MARDISDDNILKIRDGLSVLANAVDTLADRPAAQPAPIADRSLSGNVINGGTITNFQSVGIKDSSTRLTVLVNNEGILTDNIDVSTLVGDTAVSGNLNVSGNITASNMHVANLTTDIRQSRTESLKFETTDGDTLTNKGLHWVGEGHTKQFVYQTNPDRFFSSENIELHRGRFISIEGQKIIDASEIGAGVRHSSLTSVGRLRNLETAGDLNIDNMVFWNSDQERLGIRTDQPHGLLSLAGNDAELVIDADNDSFKIGTWTANDLHLVTDDIRRISVSATGNITIGTKGSDNTKLNVYGKIGVGVNNIDPDVSMQIAGPIKFSNKKFEVGQNYPTVGTYKRGDIVWNDEPNAGSWVGWICVADGSPGDWKPFGAIGR